MRGSNVYELTALPHLPMFTRSRREAGNIFDAIPRKTITSSKI